MECLTTMTTHITAYPLKFEPIFKERIWGGRRLKSHFGKNLPPGNMGESWELADLPHDKSVIANGPWAGLTLADVIAKFPEAITGYADFQGPFPLLIKLLDAQDILSVQVHPDPATCHRMGQGDPKTECWYIIGAEPGAFIYKGIKAGTSPAAFAAAIEAGTVEDLLDRVEVQPGQCHFLPSGTAHAIGGGLLIAEIQQPSDTTYRVFDYNRLDKNGQPRPLHINEALESIHFDVSARDLPVTSQGRLVDSEFFTVDKLHLSPLQNTSYQNTLSVLLILSGTGSLFHADRSLDMSPGDCILIPASCSSHLSSSQDLHALVIRPALSKGRKRKLGNRDSNPD